jgi:HK97 gp10 family phage protein
VPGGFVSYGSPGGRRSDAFAQDIARWAQDTRLRVDAVVQGVAAEIATRLAQRTHVITGRLVGNWVASLNVEDFNYDAERFDPGRTEALARNLRAISLAQAGDRIFITNHTPYLIYEEFGTSRRPPHPIVRGVIAEIPQITGEVVARVRSGSTPSIGQRVRAFFGSILGR